jgi:hypothetical protein
MGAGFGPIAVGIAIEVAMLYPHVLTIPLATASLALSEAKSQEPPTERWLVVPGRPGRFNFDNFKSGRAQYARDL